MKDRIVIRGARQHNLKGFDLEIPRRSVTVVTGPSGSGKSSLAFDTIYAEGQRRYVESLSVYARQFLERMQKPDVELLSGISPAVAIEQKTLVRNPRSTVGTQTEIYDYLRVLYARIGITYCANDGTIVQKETPATVIAAMRKVLKDGDKYYILFPMHRHEQHTLKDEWQNLREQGFFRVTVAGRDTIFELSEQDPKTIKPEQARILVDRLIWRSEDEGAVTRLAESIEAAFGEGGGKVIIAKLNGDGTTTEYPFSSRF